MIKLSRETFLQRLECVSPGLTPKEEIQQSHCFVFRRGRVITFNDELLCKHFSKLPKELEFAAPARQLLGTLYAISTDELTVELTDARFVIRGKGKETYKVPIMEVELPTEGVDKPGEWENLNPDFAGAVELVRSCVDDKHPIPKFRCLHCTPKYVEGTDNVRVMRHEIKSGFKGKFLVNARLTGLTSAMGMTMFSVTENWLHLKNPDGLTCSLRLEPEPETFPDSSEFMKLTGTQVKLPKSVVRAMDGAKVFADLVSVTLDGTRMSINAAGEHGEFSDEKKVAFDGKVSFVIDREIFRDVAEKADYCEVTDKFIKANGGNFIYLSEYHTEKERTED